MMNHRVRNGGILFILLLLYSPLFAKTYVEKGESSLVKLSPEGKLVYQKDKRGNRIPDFSMVGYHYGEKAIPKIEVKCTLSEKEGDDTVRIQDALDKIAKLPIDENGFRGALLLKKGTYKVEGSLNIRDSGIVLRGEGSTKDGTTIIATGYGKKKNKRTLISIGKGKKIELIQDSKLTITDSYVPVGAKSFSLNSTKTLKVGDRVAVHRPATKEWIELLDCSKFGWIPEDYHISFKRIITEIKDNRITLNAPIVQALDSKYGGGYVYHYNTERRVSEIGIEFIRLMSEFSKPTADNPYGNPKKSGSSEKHGWDAIKINRNTEHTWVRNVTGKYFGWSLVSVSGKNATVQDCASLGHASKIEGGRRYPFMINGQLNLMQRCVAIGGRHEFVNQARTPGPNVFVDCIGYRSHSSCGPHHRYSMGDLYDNIQSGKHMESYNRGKMGSGHGWAGAQTLFYNCMAPAFRVKSPPEGICWVIGSGKKGDTVRVKPESLYYQQVKDRLGEKALRNLVSDEQIKTLGQYLWSEKHMTRKKDKK